LVSAGVVFADCVNTLTDDMYVNDTVTLCTGTYQINDSNNDGLFIVNKSNTVLDCNGSTITGNDTGIGVMISGKSNIVLMNCTFIDYNVSVLANNSQQVFLNNTNSSSSATYDVVAINDSEMIGANVVVDQAKVVLGNDTTNITIKHDIAFLIRNTTNNSLISGATVTANDKFGTQWMSATTDSTGTTAVHQMPEFIRDFTNYTYYTNYSVTVANNSYPSVTYSVNFTGGSTITLYLDQIVPEFNTTSMTRNQYNYTNANQNITASVQAKDDHASGVKNVRCKAESNRNTVYSDAIVTGTQGDWTIFNCSGLTVPDENDYNLSFIVYDYTGNSNETKAIQFTTNVTTTNQTDNLGTLTVEAVNISDLNVSNKNFSIDVSFSNDANASMHNVRVFYSYPPGLPSYMTLNSQNVTCDSLLLPGETCTVEFNGTITGATPPNNTAFTWEANWTDNNMTAQPSMLFNTWAFVNITSNAQITANDTLNVSASTGSLVSLDVSVDSTGNVNLTETKVTYTAGTFSNDYLNFTTANLTTITVSGSKTFNLNFTLPSSVTPGTYTGTFNVNTAEGVSKSIALVVNVQETPGISIYLVNDTKYAKTGVNGELAVLVINNTGNTDQSFSLSYFNDSNIISNKLSSVVVQGSSSYSHQYLFTPSPIEKTYLADIIITPNVSTAESERITLIVENTDPTISITAPTNNAYVNDTVAVTVTANDNNDLSRIEFFIDNDIKYNDTNKTLTFSWNTTSYSDGIYSVMTRAVDRAGNYKEDSINVTVNNTQNAPIIVNALADFSFNEDTVNDSVNLTDVFLEIDNEAMTFESVQQNNSNLTVAINQATGIVTITPDANFFGSETINFTALDPTRKNVTDIVVVTVVNVNDIPDTPTLTTPANGEIVTNNQKTVTLNWSTYDNDTADTLTAYVFFGNSSSPGLNTTTTNRNITISNLNTNTTYYWKVYINDGTNVSENSSEWSFNFYTDQVPVIDDYSPKNTTQTMVEDDTLTFWVNVTDPEGSALTYNWYIDNVLNFSNSDTFVWQPSFNSSGTRTVKVIAEDNNSNTVSREWSVQVDNLNRAPVMNPFGPIGITEDQSASITLTAVDDDIQFGDSLTFTAVSLNASLTMVKKENGTNATVTLNFTPGNEHVGSLIINVTATDTSGGKGSVLANLTVNNVNDAPELVEVSDQSLTEDQNFVLDMNATDIDPSETLTFGDNASIFDINTTTGVIDFTPTQAMVGSHTVNITVTDSGAAVDTQTIVFTVSGSNDAPTITAITDKTVDQGSNLLVQVAATDDDQDTLSYSDNTTMFDINATSGLINFTPTNADVGNHSILVTVSDGNGGQASTSFKITVNNVNDLPSITSTAPTTATEGQIWAYTVVVSDLDADIGLDNFSYTVNDTRFNQSGDTFNFTPTEQDVNLGSISARFAVFDNGGASDNQVVNIVINNVNDDPVITTTPVTTGTEDTAYQYDVDATDEDSADTLTYSLGGTVPTNMTINSTSGVVDWIPRNEHVGNNTITVQVSDGTATVSQVYDINVSNVNDNPVITSTPGATGSQGSMYTYTLVASDDDVSIGLDNLSYAVNDSRMTQTDNVFNFTPTQSDVDLGVLWFKYTVVDNNGASVEQVANLTITNANDAPTITSTPVTSATEDTAYQYDVQATDVDTEDTLTYSLGGTVPTNMTINSTSGVVDWIPRNEHVGNNTITVQVSDGTETVEQVYDIDVANVNDNPVITSTPAGTATQGVVYQYAITATDDDVGDNLSYAINSSRLTQTGNVFNFTPTQTDVNAGVLSLKFTVVDDNGGSAEQTIVITIINANEAPDITSTAVTTATEDSTYTYDVDAVDSDGDSITYSLDTVIANMSINSTTGVITWIPQNSQVGANTVVARATDNNSAYSTQTFVVNVSNVNDAPVITSKAPSHGQQGVVYSYSMAVDDVDAGDTLNYSVNDSRFSITSNTFYFTPNQTDVDESPIWVKFRVQDAAGASDEEIANITIVDSEEAPYLDPIDDITVNETDTVVVTAVGHDPDGDNLTYSINDSRFSQVDNVFTWVTTVNDSGVYPVKVTVSDGELTDDEMLTVTVNDLKDTDGDGIPDRDDVDDDNDGIVDAIDTLQGDVTTPTTNVGNFAIEVDNSTDLGQLFTGKKLVEFNDGQSPLVWFYWNFTIQNVLDLRDVSVVVQNTGNQGGIQVSGVTLQSGYKKMIVMPDLNDSVNSVCVLDRADATITQVSANCNQADETLVVCDGSEQNGYTCTDIGTQFIITGLQHSAVLQQNNGTQPGYDRPVPPPPRDLPARQTLQIERIRSPDYVQAGDLLDVTVDVENIGEKELKHMKLTVVVPELGLRKRVGMFELGQNDDTTRRAFIEIPSWAPPGEYTVRITISDDARTRRVRHRQFVVY